MLGMFRLGNPIQVSVSGYPLEFFRVTGDLAVRLQPLFAIAYEIPAKHIAFMNRLFQLSLHPGDLTFADRLDGDGL